MDRKELERAPRSELLKTIDRQQELIQRRETRLRGILYVPIREKTCLRWFANDKGADQSAQMLFTFWKVSYLNLKQVEF